MDRDFLIDLFSNFGPVTIRRMFSGYGISADGNGQRKAQAMSSEFIAKPVKIETVLSAVESHCS